MKNIFNTILVSIVVGFNLLGNKSYEPETVFEIDTLVRKTNKDPFRLRNTPSERMVSPEEVLTQEVLNPQHDANLSNNGTSENETTVKIEDGVNKGYLQFDLSDINGTITEAVLKLNIIVGGNGTTNIFKGSNTTWSETNLTTDNRPDKDPPTPYIGSFPFPNAGEEKLIVLDNSLIDKGEGKLNLVLIQKVNGEGFEIASKEYDITNLRPQLILTIEDDTMDNSLDIKEPENDANLSNNGTGENETTVKIEDGVNKGYLQFDLSDINGTITEAVLKLNIIVGGNGTTNIFKGSNTTWSETNLTTDNRPDKDSPTPYIGSFPFPNAGEEKLIVLDNSLIDKGEGKLNLVLIQKVNGEGFEIASKEYDIANLRPQLILTIEEESNEPYPDISVSPEGLQRLKENILLRTSQKKAYYDYDITDKYLYAASNFYEDVVVINPDHDNEDRGRWKVFFPETGGTLPSYGPQGLYDPHVSYANAYVREQKRIELGLTPEELPYDDPRIVYDYPINEDWVGENIHAAALLAGVLNMMNDDGSFELANITHNSQELAKELANGVFKELLAMASNDQLDASNAGSSREAGEPIRPNPTFLNDNRFNSNPQPILGQTGMAPQRGHPFFLSATKIKKLIVSYRKIQPLIQDSTTPAQREYVEYWFKDWARWAKRQMDALFATYAKEDWQDFRSNDGGYKMEYKYFSEQAKITDKGSSQSTHVFWDETGEIGTYPITASQQYLFNNRNMEYAALVHTYGLYFDESSFKKWGNDYFEVLLILGMWEDGTWHEGNRNKKEDIAKFYPFNYTHLSLAILIEMAMKEKHAQEHGVIQEADVFILNCKTRGGSGNLYPESEWPLENNTAVIDPTRGKKSLLLMIKESLKNHREVEGGYRGDRYNEFGIQLTPDNMLYGKPNFTPYLPYAIVNEHYNDGEIRSFVEKTDGRYLPYVRQYAASYPSDAGEGWASYFAAGSYLVLGEYGTSLKAYVPEQKVLVNKITLSPNPSSKTIVLNGFENINDVGDIKLYSIDGRYLGIQKVIKKDGGIEILVDKYPKGIYILKTTDSLGNTHAFKFIKN